MKSSGTSRATVWTTDLADNQSNPTAVGSPPESDLSEGTGTERPSFTLRQANKGEDDLGATAKAKSPLSGGAVATGAHGANPKPEAKPKSKPKSEANPKPETKPKPKPKPKAKPSSPALEDPVYAPARKARAKTRHWMLILSFILCVCLPLLMTGGYLWSRAVDQYTSNFGFTVRREEAPSAVDILGGLSKLSNSSSSDSDILYEYIQTQEMVEKVDDLLDLRTLYSRHYEIDPVFSLEPGSSINELVEYWQKMVLISYAPGTGLIEVKVKAFTPEDAHEIAQAIFSESSLLINNLSAIARQDSIRYAQEELEVAVEQLKEARQALTAFRSRTQIVDPSADIQLQMGLLNTLQQQLGTQLIDYDLLLTSVKEGDPRLQQAKQRIDAIRSRIREERDKFGGGGNVARGEDYATLIANFERLSVDQEFAEQKYTGALQNYDIAQANAQRQSRYLAAYLNPTRAQTPEYPRRSLLLGLTALFLLIAWSTLMLILYSLRDRR